jgi:molecular chaperone HscB
MDTKAAGAQKSLPCWNCGEPCGEPQAAADACGECGAIVAPPKRDDHFAALGLPRRYALDPAQVRRAYLELSRRFHPDRYGQKTPRERRLAVEKTAALNDAYKTLTDPIARAEYLLSQEAGLKDLEKLRADPATLEAVLERRERILELKAEGDRDALTEERRRAEAERAEIAAGLLALFARVDAGDKAALAEVERAVVAHRYNRGVLSELAAFA